MALHGWMTFPGDTTRSVFTFSAESGHQTNSKMCTDTDTHSILTFDVDESGPRVVPHTVRSLHFPLLGRHALCFTTVDVINQTEFCSLVAWNCVQLADFENVL